MKRVQSVRAGSRFYHCMIALLQRATQGRVTVDGQVVAEIGSGLVVLLGVVRGDDVRAADRLLERILNYRVFADPAGRMNLSLRDVSGALLLIPQFTLAAETERGNRPGFSRAADPVDAAALYHYVLTRARSLHALVAGGRFGAPMQVSLVNDGPVTFWLESGKQTL
ncbi:MAG TPA: D-aminoacyl-tRNA deacylase [Steroidobacteraceae bacterium]|jgi:D-tyrosyl-tRNA(Tyr) deacylase|nr:D-aminoacyl-tRNA deacylase [Steroidobacteraceae bacterium]